MCSGLFLTSCFTDTIDSLSTFTFQLALNFQSDHNNRTAPDTSEDFTNLNEYKEYRDNKERVEKAEMLQVNYWINELKYEIETSPGNKKTFDYDPQDVNAPEFIFESITFKLRFAKSRTGNDNSLNPNDWYPDPDEPTYTLGVYKDVNIKEYYRRADHIIDIEEDVSKIISEAVKNRPSFYIYTEYSKVKVNGEIQDEYSFPFVGARYTMMIRFQVKL